jgi:hypothetical protein
MLSPHIQVPFALRNLLTTHGARMMRETGWLPSSPALCFEGMTRGTALRFRREALTVSCRHVDDHFLGRPILEIPRTHPPKLIWVDLTVEERLIYR